MTTEIVPISVKRTPASSGIVLPEVIVREGERTVERFLEFFTANIRNKNTRLAYARAVAAYIEELGGTHSAPTVKQHLAAIRMLSGWLVLGQSLPLNPASSVKGPRHIVKRCRTPVLDADQARTLLDSIVPDRTKNPDAKDPTIADLRDRALIGVMVYSFARIGAVVGMNGEDYYQNGKRWWLRFHEKGGKQHELPAHHNAEAYLDAYLAAAGIKHDKKGPLFRTLDRRHCGLTGNRLHRNEVLAMIKRWATAAGLPATTCCHTFRATGFTVYLRYGGTLEKAQQFANHESPKTTKL